MKSETCDFPAFLYQFKQELMFPKIETFPYICVNCLVQYFQTRFLEQANEFIAGLDPKAARKLFYNIDLAEQTNDPRLFKKLKDDIWELRVRYGSIQIRLLAFWDKSDSKSTLVIATHGFIKKVDKVPENEIERAKNLRNKYFESKK
jgi:phage-related protein